MLILKLIAGFLQALNAKATPRAIAGGFALGAVIGLTPKGSLHNAVILLLIFLLPVNKSASIVSAILLAIFAPLGDPLFNALGRSLLTAPSLRGVWTTLYNTPVVPWTRFNNTLVLGSLLVSIALSVPLFYAAVWGVKKYRERIVAVASKWKIVHLIKVSKLYALYEKLS